MDNRTIDLSAVPLEQFRSTRLVLTEVGIQTLPAFLEKLYREIEMEINARFHKANSVGRGLKDLGFKPTKEFVDEWVALAFEKKVFRESLTPPCLCSGNSQNKVGSGDEPR